MAPTMKTLLLLFVALLAFARSAAAVSAKAESSVAFADVSSPMGKQLQAGEIVHSSSTGGRYKITELIHSVGVSSGLGAIAARPSGALATTSKWQTCYAHHVPADSSEAHVHGMVHDHANMDISLKKGSKRVVHGDSSDCGANCGYSIDEMCGRGSHGEVWRAKRVTANGDEETGSYVLKRLYHDKPAALLSGFREIHFGLLPFVRNSSSFSRYVEHWQTVIEKENHDNDAIELWIVFKDEGTSLNRLLYEPVATADGTSLTLKPSRFWRRLWTEPAGKKVFKLFTRQLIAGLAILHENEVLHRDIKTSNIILGVERGGSHLRIADFGSAVDDYAQHHLYTADGPSQLEETLDYAPPEVRFSDKPYDAVSPASYDMFSVGLVLLELLFAQPPWQLFTVTARDEAILRKIHEGKPPEFIKRAILQRCFDKLCIRRDCAFEDFSASLQQLTYETKQSIENLESNGRSDDDKSAYMPFVNRQAALEAAPELPRLAPPEGDHEIQQRALMNAALAQFPTNERVNSLFDEFALATIRAGGTLDMYALPIPEIMSRGHSSPTSSMSNSFNSLLDEDGERLLFHLLQWGPSDRLSAQHALQHPYLASM